MSAPRIPRSLARALRRRRDPRGPQWAAIALTIAVAILIAGMPKARAADLGSPYNGLGSVNSPARATDI